LSIYSSDTSHLTHTSALGEFLTRIPKIFSQIRQENESPAEHRRQRRIAPRERLERRVRFERFSAGSLLDTSVGDTQTVYPGDLVGRRFA
jgi:hypothetical protein